MLVGVAIGAKVVSEVIKAVLIGMVMARLGADMRPLCRPGACDGGG